MSHRQRTELALTLVLQQVLLLLLLLLWQLDCFAELQRCLMLPHRYSLPCLLPSSQLSPQHAL